MATTRRFDKRICFTAAAALVLLAPPPSGGGGGDGPARAHGDDGPEQILAVRLHGDDALEAPADETEDQGPASIPVAAGAEVDRVPPAEGSAENGLGADSIQVSKAGNVEMHVDELPLSTVLEVLSVRSKRNIVSTPNVSGTVTAHLYNVTFEEALDAVLLANRAGYREVGNFIYVYTNAELAEIIAAETPPVTRVFPLYYLKATDALAVITPMLSELGTAVATPESETGLTFDVSEAGGDNMAHQDYLVVRDRPDVLDHIEQTLVELDVRPMQVLVEATILAVTLDDENALGVDFTVVGGFDLEAAGSISNPAAQNLTVGPFPDDRWQQLNANVTTDFSQIVPRGGITIGVIKDRLGMFVRALEEITDTVVLANPKVLALNKQKAQVIVGRRDGYITTTVTETQAIQTVEFLETGTQLIFRPFIGSDGFIRMELHPEDSAGSVVNGLPSERTTEVTTNVMVRDGQTILIGGLFREVSVEARNQVPLLGNIPVVGTVFQGRSDSTIREEVIILLTVHVVKDQDAYARAGEKAREDLERMRVGMRRKMMWNGRERLAQAHYHKSLEHFADGETDKALWDVRMALHNYPSFVSAIELKEKILGRRDWDDEGTNTREFIHQLILEDQGVRRAPFSRLAPPFIGPKDPPGPDGLEGGEFDDAP